LSELPIEFLRRASSSVGRKWSVSPEDLFQEGALKWLEECTAPSRLRASRAYWAMTEYAAAQAYGSMAAYSATKAKQRRQQDKARPRYGMRYEGGKWVEYLKTPA
jgi:hypothetical protein